jgi:hypothetical protein
VHSLEYLERYARSRSNRDLCTLDESRYFVRGIVPVPFQDLEGDFRWGVWAEVSRETHDRYFAGFSADLTNSAPATGTLANTIPGYLQTIGVEVEIQFQDAGSRPKFVFPAEASHALAYEQRSGISGKRHHDILEKVGHFAEDSDA